MKRNLLIILISFATLSLIGCAKDPQNLGYSRVMFVNGIPNVSNMDILVDNVKQNIVPINFGANTIYYGITPGQRSILINGNLQVNLPNGLTQIASSTQFQQGVFTIDRNDNVMPNYTLIAANTTRNPEFIFVQDDLTTPASGNAGIRIIHAGPDAPRVNAFIGAGTTPIFSASNGFGYKEFSSFTAIPALSTGTSYSIQIRNSSTGAVLRTQTLTATSGKLYTIILRGLVAADPSFPTNTLSSTLVGNN